MFQPLKLTAALALRVERTSGRQRAERTGDTGGGRRQPKQILNFHRTISAPSAHSAQHGAGVSWEMMIGIIFLCVYTSVVSRAFVRFYAPLILSTFDFSNEQVHTYKTIKTQRRKKTAMIISNF